MPVALRIEGFEHLDRSIEAIDKAVNLAAARTVREMGQQATTAWARAIGEEINLPIRDIKAAIRVHPSNRAAIKIEVDSRNVASLGVGKRVRSVPIIKFNPTIGKHGVRVKIKKKKAAEVIRTGFKQTVGGHTGIYRRVYPGGKPRYGKGSRIRPYPSSDLPIKEIKTTAIEDVARDTVPMVQQFVDNKLPIVFERNLRYILNSKQT